MYSSRATKQRWAPDRSTRSCTASTRSSPPRSAESLRVCLLFRPRHGRRHGADDQHLPGQEFRLPLERALGNTGDDNLAEFELTRTDVVAGEMLVSRLTPDLLEEMNRWRTERDMRVSYPSRHASLRPRQEVDHRGRVVMEHLRPGEQAVANLVYADDRSVEPFAGRIDRPLAVEHHDLLTAGGDDSRGPCAAPPRWAAADPRFRASRRRFPPCRALFRRRGARSFVELDFRMEEGKQALRVPSLDRSKHLEHDIGGFTHGDFPSD